MRNQLFVTKAKPRASPDQPKPRAPRFRTFSRAEKIALFANGVIWTLVIWVALIMALLQDGPAMWVWLIDGAAPAQAAPLTATPWLAPQPTATSRPSPTATSVVTSPETVPEQSGASSAVPPTRAGAAPPPIATAELSPPSAQAEVAAVTLSQPAAPSPDSELSEPTPVPWPPPSDPPPPLTPHQRRAMPTHLIIESVGIDAAVIPVGWHTIERDGQLTSAWEVAENAVGWHQNSALPGETGNTVLAAHSNIGGEVFRYLSEVNKGDQIIISTGGRTLTYEITFTTIVKEAGVPLEVRKRNARWIAPTDDARLTLVTCWPYPHSTHRFIVVATPIEA